MSTFTEQDHKAHDPLNAPEPDCSFCTAARRQYVDRVRHGDGAGSVVIPVPPKVDE